MVRRAANSTPSRVNALMAGIQGRRRGRTEENLSRQRRPSTVSCGPQRESGRRKIFYGNRGTPREIAHCRWRNELYDPLSSFVPELEPRHRRGFSFRSGPSQRKPQPCLESAPSPSGAGYRGRWRLARPRSRCVAGIDVGRSFLFALFRHHRGARATLLTAPAEPLLRDVVLARPAIFPSLTYKGLLANGLNHSLRPL
jgi:hypothetical protein